MNQIALSTNDIVFNVFYVPASFESFQEAVKNKSCLVTASFLKNLIIWNMLPNEIIILIKLRC